MIGSGFAILFLAAGLVACISLTSTISDHMPRALRLPQMLRECPDTCEMRVRRYTTVVAPVPTQHVQIERKPGTRDVRRGFKVARAVPVSTAWRAAA